MNIEELEKRVTALEEYCFSYERQKEKQYIEDMLIVDNEDLRNFLNQIQIRTTRTVNCITRVICSCIPISRKPIKLNYPFYRSELIKELGNTEEIKKIRNLGLRSSDEIEISIQVFKDKYEFKPQEPMHELRKFCDSNIYGIQELFKHIIKNTDMRYGTYLETNFIIDDMSEHSLYLRRTLEQIKDILAKEEDVEFEEFKEEKVEDEQDSD